jgi:hypothetical protein
MHCAILSGVIRDTKLLQSLSATAARTIRSITISAILGTDMIHHFSQIADLRVSFVLFEIKIIGFNSIKKI